MRSRSTVGVRVFAGGVMTARISMVVFLWWSYAVERREPAVPEPSPTTRALGSCDPCFWAGPVSDWDWAKGCVFVSATVEKVPPDEFPLVTLRVHEVLRGDVVLPSKLDAHWVEHKHPLCGNDPDRGSVPSLVPPSVDGSRLLLFVGRAQEGPLEVAPFHRYPDTPEARADLLRALELPTTTALETKMDAESVLERHAPPFMSRASDSAAAKLR